MVSISSTNNSSIWSRRIANKSAPCLATSAANWGPSAPSPRDQQVELDVRSLLLNLPLYNTHSSTTRHDSSEQYHRSSPQDIPQPPMSPVEMHTAQTAVKAALDVLLNEDVPMDTNVRSQRFPQLRISTVQSSLSAPLSPLSPGLSSFDSPLLSPAESCFSSSSDAEISAEDDENAEPKRKGRARMSQEKRKRLARRREREAALLIAAQQQQQYFPQQPQNHHYQQMQMQMQYGCMSRSAPVSPTMPHSPFGAVNNASDSFFFAQVSAGSPLIGTQSTFMQSAASDMLPALSSSPTSSPMSSAASSPLGHMLPPLSPIGSSRSARSKSPSPPTLVIQPPSPQRLLLKQSQQQYHFLQHHIQQQEHQQQQQQQQRQSSFAYRF